MRSILLALLFLTASPLAGAPAPLPRPRPLTEVVVELHDGDLRFPRVEVMAGARKHTIQGKDWEADLEAHLRWLRRDAKAPNLKVTVHEMGEVPAATYLRLIRACRAADFERVLLGVAPR